MNMLFNLFALQSIWLEKKNGGERERELCKKRETKAVANQVFLAIGDYDVPDVGTTVKMRREN